MFEREELDEPLITDYGKEGDYVRRFWDRYVDKKKQPFDSTRCSFEGCSIVKKYSHQIRNHYMTHLKGPEYEKFVCKRCDKNYESFKNLRQHGDRGMCYKVREFPKQSVLMTECLKQHPEQDPKSKECSNCKNGKKFVSPFVCRQHFMPCVHFIIECTNCESTYSTYNAARKHFEKCIKGEPSEKKVNKAFFNSDAISPPTDKDDREWSDKEMIEHMEKIAIPKIQALFARFPPGGYGTIGMTSNPLDRFSDYRKHKEVYQKHEASPRLLNNEHILFRCWSKEIALKYEYLLQRHTIQRDGKFYSILGTQINQQKVQKPSKNYSHEKKAHYVYFQVSREPFTYRKKKKEESSSNLQSTSTSLACSSKSKSSTSTTKSTSIAKTSSKKRIIISSDSSDDDIFAPPVNKKFK